MYAIAFVLVGIIGMVVCSLIARRGGQPNSPSTAPATSAASAVQRRIAPSWTRRVALTCLVLGGVSLLRLLFNGDSYFLWGGLLLLAIGALLPSLVVALGGGQQPER